MEIVRDHAKSDPALHAGIAAVDAASQPVSPLQHADAALTSGPPFLALLEPALLLLGFPFDAFGGAIRDAHAFDASVVRGGFVLGRVESRVAGYHMGRAAEPFLMRIQGRDQQL